MNRRGKRIGALLLAVSLLFGQLGVNAYAEETVKEGGGLCKHHPVHTADCGYVEAQPGISGSHEHTDACYKTVVKCVHEHTAECYPEGDISEDDATPSNAEALEPTECSHICDEDAGCVTKMLDCSYIPKEETEGSPCGFVCEICEAGKDEDLELLSSQARSGYSKKISVRMAIDGGDETSHTHEGGDCTELGTTHTITITPEKGKYVVAGYFTGENYYDTNPEEYHYNDMALERITPSGAGKEEVFRFTATEYIPKKGNYDYICLYFYCAKLPERIWPSSTVSGGEATAPSEDDTVKAVPYRSDRELCGDPDAYTGYYELSDATDRKYLDWEVLSVKDAKSDAELGGEVSFEDNHLTYTPTAAEAGKTVQIQVRPNLGYVTEENTPITFEVDVKKPVAESKEFWISTTVVGNGDAMAFPFSAEAGTVISLSAEPNDGYLFMGWEVVSGDITIEDDQFIMPAGDVEIKALFESIPRIAKPLIENETYTVAQSDANTADAVKDALVRQINAMDDMKDLGITVSAEDIVLDSFIPAISGSKDKKNGTDGSFSFTATISKGSAPDASASKDGTITATAYIDSDDAALKDLSLSAGTLSPEFAPATLSYTATVDYSVSSIDIIANANNAYATVAGDIGTKDLIVGDNPFTVTVTAEDGLTTQAYTITITRKPSSDAMLKSLTVTGVTLNEAFTPATTSYTASAEYGINSVTISAEANDGNAAVTGDIGTRSLAVGVNTFTITVTAQDSSTTKTYAVTITRKEAADTSGGNSGSSGGNGGGSGSSGGSGSHATGQTSTQPQPDTATAVITIGQADPDGKAEILTGQITEALNKVAADAQKNNTTKKSVTVSLPSGTTTATLAQEDLDKLVAAEIMNFQLDYHGISLGFDLNALKEIAAQTTGTVIFDAKKATGLSGDALAAIGTRPVYDVTIIGQKDGQTVPITDFGSGRVALALAYIPTAEERNGGLYLVRAEHNGGVTWIGQSGYDGTAKRVAGFTSRFSTYGVGYKTPPAFADTEGHWAKDDMDYAAARGLLTGTGATTISPDAPVTRGIFVTALGKLAGIDPAAYAASGRFTDVSAAVYYAPYVEWAASMGIMAGTGEQTFSPDMPVTREQMAAVMQQYADTLGYRLPKVREAAVFTDDSQIDNAFKAAVQAMQQAGVMDNRDGNRFGPKDTATRAETAAVLRRFMEAVLASSAVRIS